MLIQQTAVFSCGDAAAADAAPGRRLDVLNLITTKRCFTFHVILFYHSNVHRAPITKALTWYM